MNMPERRPTPPRLQWWLDARFGVSYHWGLYSIPARGEWVRSAERMTVEDYQRYFHEFTADRYDPRQWARLAREAGAGYAILTTKHHDGFCLFDSALTDYHAGNTPARRDLVREFVDAVRAEGLRVGLYYSLVDWHHPDYPAWGDRQHPMRDNPAFKDRPHHWPNYVAYLHGQVRELLSNYGQIDLLLFDFSYNDFFGARWGAVELLRMIRQLQPDIVVNDRLGNAESGSLKDVEAPAWAGDFDTCELNMPDRAPTDGRGRVLPWDLWITHTNAWCHHSGDKEFKAAPDIIRTLVNCVSKDGNLTLNFAPDARGQLPRESVELQREIGRWMARYGESIRGCGSAPEARPDWGRFTRRGGTLYAHILEQPMGHLTLPGLRGRVARPRHVADGAEAYLTDFWNHPVQKFGRPDDIFFNTRLPAHQTYALPDRTDTVVAFDYSADR